MERATPVATMQHAAAAHHQLLATATIQTQQQQQQHQHQHQQQGQQQQPTTAAAAAAAILQLTASYTATNNYPQSAAHLPQPQLQSQSQPSSSGHFTSLDLIIASLLVALILISIVGNCLVCVAIFTDRRLRKLGNAFIVSLAIADLFVSCLVMTFALCNDLMSHWIFGEHFCDVWISFDIMCCTASILNLCAISLDRFVHIKDCLLYNQWMTRKVALSAVIIIWFISGLVSFVPINLGWHKPDHFGSGGGGGVLISAPQSSSDLALKAANNNNNLNLIFQGANTATEAQLDLAELDGLSKLVRLDGQQQQQQQQGRGQSDEAPKLNYNSRRPISPASGSLGSTFNGELAADLNQTRSIASLPSPPPIATKLSFLSGLPDIGGSPSDYSAHSSWQRKQARSSGTLTIAGESNKLASHRPAGFNWQPHSRAEGSQGEGLLEGSAVGFSGHLRPLNSGLPGQQSNQTSKLLKQSQQQQQQQQLSSELPQCMLSLTPTYAIISSTISFYIPCIIMLGLYTKLWACARRHVKNIQAISKAPAPIALTAAPGSISLLDPSVGSGGPEPAGAGAYLSTCAAQIKQARLVPPFKTPPLKTWLKFKRSTKSSGKKTTRNGADDYDAQLNDDNKTNSIAGSAGCGDGTTTSYQLATTTTVSKSSNNNNCTSCCSRTSEQSDTLTTTMGNENNINRSTNCRQSVNNAPACRRCQSSLSTRPLLATIAGSGEPLAKEEDLISAQKFIQTKHDGVDVTNATEPPKSSPNKLANLREAQSKTQLKPLLQNQEAADNQTGTLEVTEPPPTNDEHHPFLRESSDNNNNNSNFSGKANQQCGRTGDNGSLRAVKINFAPTQYQQQQQQQQQSGQLATHKAAITLGIIMGTFLCCWVPFFCLNIIKAFCVDCIPGSLFRFFTWLGYANSALNPIIYGIHNSEFRNAFNRIFFKHLNIKNSRYYMNRRSSYDLRHANHRLTNRNQRGRFRKSFDQQADSKQAVYKSDTAN